MIPVTRHLLSKRAPSVTEPNSEEGQHLIIMVHSCTYAMHIEYRTSFLSLISVV